MKLFKCEDGSLFRMDLLVSVMKCEDNKGIHWKVVVDAHERDWFFISQNDYERLMIVIKDLGWEVM